MAEFVDNALQSFLNNRDELLAAGVGGKVQVAIELNDDGDRITIRDNAAGIHESEYERAFRPAEVPPDRSGLAEFGMGLKSASCWFAPRWTVRTSALGEAVERSVSFDIERIVRDDLEDLDVRVIPAAVDAHYTEITLSDVFRPPRGRTKGKIKDHLGSIYRIFLRDGILELKFDGELLSYEEPAILVAPPFREPTAQGEVWRKEVALDFGGEQFVHGFAALREVGSTSEAGFALFRRNRLIQGSREEAYRPPFIFGASNSYTYQRLFGELHLDGFEVSHTKDGFQWEEHEEIVLEQLKEALNADPLPLLSQAEGHRSRVRTQDVQRGAQVAVQRTADAVAEHAAGVLSDQLDSAPSADVPPESLPEVALASRRTIAIELNHQQWEVDLELSTEPGIGDWVYLSEQPSGPASRRVRRVGIRVSLVHPFMERFGGADASQIEPLLRVAVALVLAEVTAREGGVRGAGAIRDRVNQLLREALSQP